MFLPVETWLLIACDTAFYAIIRIKERTTLSEYMISTGQLSKKMKIKISKFCTELRVDVSNNPGLQIS